MLKFKKHDLPYREVREKREAEIKKAADAVIGAAETCFNDEKFKKYLESYKALESECLKRLIEIDANETDPIQYGFQCKDVIKTMRLLGSFKLAVTREAAKHA